MPRHARSVDARARTTRQVTLIVVWLGGLAAGFFGLLSAAAKYGCGSSDKGFACKTSGSLTGVLVIIAVVALVTAVTVLTFDRPPRRTITVGGIGLIGLLLCYFAAQGLLSTV